MGYPPLAGSVLLPPVTPPPAPVSRFSQLHLHKGSDTTTPAFLPPALHPSQSCVPLAPPPLGSLPSPPLRFGYSYCLLPTQPDGPGSDHIVPLLRAFLWLHLTQGKSQIPPRGPQGPTWSAPGLSDLVSPLAPLLSLLQPQPVSTNTPAERAEWEFPDGSAD